MRLILVRHGQTPANVLGQLDTAHPGPGLTERGFEQAERVPEALRGENIDAIYVSTLIRTQLTAAPLVADLGLAATVLGGIHEIEAGDLERRSDVEAIHAYHSTVFAWGSGDLDKRMPGDQDGHAFFGRYDADIAEIADSGAETVVVVSHGAAIRVWSARYARNIDPEIIGRNDLMNTGIVIFEGSFAAGWNLVSWQGTPVDGLELADLLANDPTGEGGEE